MPETDTKKRKINPDKQMTFLKADLTMQFVPVSKSTGKPISLPEGPSVYSDQRDLIDALIRFGVREKVVIMSRYLSKWKVQSNVHIPTSPDSDSCEADIFHMLTH